MKIGKILIPLDGSALAEAVLPRAVELARDSGAKVELLRAVEAHTIPGVDPTAAQIKVVEEGEAYLRDVAGRLKAEGVKSVETSVWYGPAAYAIVEAARLHKADLITMTTHGRSGLGRLILGSVAESVLRGTAVPILLIRVAEAPVELLAAKGVAKPWPKVPHV
jgi:nucleotide-binding universal stress UspA family protein